MLFNSLNFILFLIVIIVFFYLMPRKLQPIFLLLASYCFYMSWKAEAGLFLLAITAITYIAGILLEKSNNKQIKNGILVLAIVLNLSVLLAIKYLDFAVLNINQILRIMHKEEIDFVLNMALPIGISFYTLQSLGYVIDVYRGSVKANRNFLSYAVFVSFFPQLLAGPIERAKNLFPQLTTKKQFDVNRVRSGLLLMLWGYFLKVLIADNLALMVDPIIDSYSERLGIEVLIAIILYGFQIYCDFAGYSNIAIGIAEVLGFHLMRNFNCPYMSTSIDEFWTRWHISLTSWFRDYLYIPLGGGRKGIVRKYINILFIFLVSGLWHGASWAFVAWGGLNGIMVIASKAKNRIIHKRLPTVLGCIITFCLVDFTWLFFRASDFSEAICIIKKILGDFRLAEINLSAFLAALPDKTTAFAILVALIILFIVDYMQYREINVRQWVFNRTIIIRWTIYLLLLTGILVFGDYGNAYGQTQFIYFQF